MKTRRMETKHTRMLENIYDLIKEQALPIKQNDEWAKLSRKHAKEAKKELRQWLKEKEMVYTKEAIAIGKHFIIKLI